MDSSIPIGLKLRCLELIDEGYSISAVASLFGWNRKTLHKWQGRYRAKVWGV